MVSDGRTSGHVGICHARGLTPRKFYLDSSNISDFAKRCPRKFHLDSGIISDFAKRLPSEVRLGFQYHFRHESQRQRDTTSEIGMSMQFALHLHWLSDQDDCTPGTT